MRIQIMYFDRYNTDFARTEIPKPIITLHVPLHSLRGRGVYNQSTRLRQFHM